MADTAALTELQAARKRTKDAITSIAKNITVMEQQVTDQKANLTMLRSKQTELETAITSLGGTLEG